MLEIQGNYNISPRFDNGPTQSAFLNCPVGITCRESFNYIAEHPTDHQGSVQVFKYLIGLKEFQLIWHTVSRAFGWSVEKKDGQAEKKQTKEEYQYC